MSRNNSATKRDEQLSPEQIHVLRGKGTEPAFSGLLLHNKNSGIYKCVGCGSELFKSSHKFDSGSGWPSFFDVAQYGAVELISDDSHGMQRTEVVCATCGGHLGHVFDDAVDQPTGQRYCINSCVLKFDEAEQAGGSSE